MRSRRLVPGPGFPPYLVLLRVGFTLPPALLPARCALTAPFHPYHCTGQLQRAAPRSGGMFSVALAVHGPPGEPWNPRPGRYPAHCPLEFGLSSPGSPLAQAPAATARPSCQSPVYRETNLFESRSASAPILTHAAASPHLRLPSVLRRAAIHSRRSLPSAGAAHCAAGR
jgi:hypothetical protein